MNHKRLLGGPCSHSKVLFVHQSGSILDDLGVVDQ